MTDPARPASFTTDPHPVRPGTSAALTARTIDATQHPPIVRAQEAVVEAIPRLADTVTSPLFLTTVGLTLVLVWMVVRLRSRMVWLVLSAIMVMTLTSFRPVRGSYRSPKVEDAPARQYERPPQIEINDEDELRAAVEDLRQRIEAELRRRAERQYRYDYHHNMRSARWMRRLPPSLQDMVMVGAKTVAAWDRNP